jgi:hypothetical protein
MSKLRHVYALFDSPQAAADAYAAVRDCGCADEHCSAIVHQEHIDESVLPNEERASREGAREGAAIVGTAGAVIAGLAALGGGILGIGPLAALVMGGGVGGAYGALLGAISGSDDPEKHLRALEREVEAGKVLIAVETDDPKLREACTREFEQRGGHPLSG